MTTESPKELTVYVCGCRTSCDKRFCSCCERWASPVPYVLGGVAEGLRQALAAARSAVLCREPMTEELEAVIDAALNTYRQTVPEREETGE